MKRIDLNGAWQGTCLLADGRVEFLFDGTVPGCVHTDLMGSHIAKDLYYRDNVDAAQWIEDRDWKYEKTFVLEEVPAKARLVFEGLDVYADIYVNGEHIAFTDDMFISHAFDVAGWLRVGENHICVHFHSPVRWVEGLPARGAAFTAERLYTRRMQCTYGWDWAARLVTCGIWRDAYIDCTDGF
ncbi:MAG: glycoside hydrolase family 2 protein, partial [Clostridia bacterium]|nr:glycoside hydrolase family 2 protein [Clostridia bacterium]